MMGLNLNHVNKGVPDILKYFTLNIPKPKPSLIYTLTHLDSIVS